MNNQCEIINKLITKQQTEFKVVNNRRNKLKDQHLRIQNKPKLNSGRKMPIERNKAISERMKQLDFSSMRENE